MIVGGCAAAITVLVALEAFALRGQTPWSLPTAAGVDHRALIAHCKEDLQTSAVWRPATKDGVALSSGFLPGIPCRAYRSDIELAGSLEDVVRFIADDMVERLPDWNREFVDGHIVGTLRDDPQIRAWLVHVFYATPPPLANREYLYYLARQRISEDEVLIVYQSVAEPIDVRPGYVRGVLSRTVHRCLRVDADRTKVEHILSNDIAGWISQRIQSHVLSGGFMAANRRDAVNQMRIFDGA